MLFYENRVLGCKIEATPGTRETLAGSDAAMNVYDADIVPELQWEERKSQGGFGLLRSYHTGQVGKAMFKMDLAYDGTNIPAYFGKLMNGCGLVLTSRRYNPVLQAPDAPSAGVKCLTIGLWLDGKFACIYGAMGNCKISMKSSQIVTLEFEFTGILHVESDSAIVSPTYPDENAVKLRAANGVTSYDAVDMCLESMTFDFGNKVIGKKCMSAEKGFDFFMVADRMPKVTANPESVLIATADWLGMMLDSEVAALLAVIPAAGYTSGGSTNQVKITAPKAQLKSKKLADRDGIAIDNLEWDCCIDTSDSNKLFYIDFLAT